MCVGARRARGWRVTRDMTNNNNNNTALVETVMGCARDTIQLGTPALSCLCGPCCVVVVVVVVVRVVPLRAHARSACAAPPSVRPSTCARVVGMSSAVAQRGVGVGRAVKTRRVWLSCARASLSLSASGHGG